LPHHTPSHTLINVHGIRSNGDSDIDLLGTALAAHPSIQASPFTYERVGIHGARNCQLLRDAGAQLRHFARAPRNVPRSSVICHSNGFNVVLEAIRQGVNFDRIFAFAPATEPDILLYDNCHSTGGFNHLHIIHNPGDIALMLGALLFRHPFGSLGRIGYTGPCPNIANHNLHITRQGDWLGHSSFFYGQNLEKCHDLVLSHLLGPTPV